jgi:hypothetical protein
MRTQDLNAGNIAGIADARELYQADLVQMIIESSEYCGYVCYTHTTHVLLLCKACTFCTAMTPVSILRSKRVLSDASACYTYTLTTYACTCFSCIVYIADTTLCVYVCLIGMAI